MKFVFSHSLAACLFLCACGAIFSSHDPVGRRMPAGERGDGAGAGGGGGADRGETGPDWQREYFRKLYYPLADSLRPGFLRSVARDVQNVPEADDALPFDKRRSVAVSRVSPWVSIGPWHNRISYGSSGRYLTGRILAIEDIAGYAMRIGAASGGLWQQRYTYTPLTEHLPTQVVGAVYTDVSNPDHIVVGTGENGQATGAGIWYTTDAGGTWIPSDQGGANPATVYCIRHNTRNPNLLYAATNWGVLVSTNRGTSWTRTTTIHTTDLVVNSIPEPATVYCTVWDSLNGGVYKSIDGGYHFSRLTGAGAPVLNTGRGSITRSNGGVLYAQFAKFTGGDGSLLGIYKSTDAGSTWSDKSPGNFLGKQGWYNNVIAVCPANPDLLLAGGVDLLRSDNGGDGWSTISQDMVHPDHHAITWSDDSRVYDGSDGGLFYSADGGRTWSSGGNFFPITQFWGFDVAQSNPQVMAGGTQDNGFVVTSDGGRTWLHTKSGDAGGFAIDPHDASHMFGVHGMYDINIFNVFLFHRVRSFDTGNSWNWCDGTFFSAIDGAGGDQQYPQIRTDASLPAVLFANSGPYVYRSENNGDGWSKLNDGAPFPAWVGNVHVQQFDGTAYFCLSSIAGNGRLKVWEGSSLADRAAGLPDSMYIQRIVSHPSQNLIFALMGGVRNWGRKIYKSRDHGRTWMHVLEWPTLPDVPVTDLVVHPLDTNKLYLGTAFGCFRTTDGGAHWYRWNSGLPDAALIQDMRAVDSLAVNGKFYIVASTYGRSVWKREVTGGDSLPLTTLANHSVFSLTLSSSPVAGETHRQVVATLDGGALGISADLGAHWMLSQLPTSGDLFSARVESLLTIVAGRSGTILRSTDHGKTWWNGSVPAKIDLYTVARSPAGLWFAGGDSGTILRSKDDGQTWERLAGGTSGGGAVRSLAFSDPLHGWGAGYVETKSGLSALLLESTDGGESWFTGQEIASGGRLNAVAFPGPGTGFIAGDSGLLYKTTTGGQTWDPVATPVKTPLAGCFFNDPLVGWVCGDNGVLLQTTDGGAGWQSIETAGQPNLTSVLAVQNILFAGSSQGVCSSPTPEITTTSLSLDQGWNMVSVPCILEDMAGRDLFPPATSPAFTYGGSYLIRDTLEFGTGYWIKFGAAASLPMAGIPVRNLAVRVKQGWNMIGSLTLPLDAASVVSDPPAGAPLTFFEYSPGGYAISDSLRPGKAYWVKSAQEGELLLSADAAPSARPKVSLPAREILTRLSTLTIRDASGSARVLYFGADPEDRLQRSGNFEMPPPPPEGCFDARFAPDGLAALSAAEPRSTRLQISSPRFPLTIAWRHASPPGVAAGAAGTPDPRAGYALMVDGKSIPMRGDGSLTIASEVLRIALQLPAQPGEHPAAGTPVAFALEQNYPNPFNPSTLISFALPERARVRIEVFNLLGQLERTLVNEERPAGNYSLPFDATGLPSGIYFCRMSSGDFFRTRKMVMAR